MGYSVRPTPTNAATLKNSAFVTLTLRTSPEDWRTNSFGVVVAAAAEEPVPDGPRASWARGHLRHDLPPSARAFAARNVPSGAEELEEPIGSRLNAKCAGRPPDSGARAQTYGGAQ